MQAPRVSSNFFKAKQVPRSPKLRVTGEAHISLTMCWWEHKISYIATTFQKLGEEVWRRTKKREEDENFVVLRNTSSTTRRRRGQGWKLKDEKRGIGDGGWNHVLVKSSKGHFTHETERPWPLHSKVSYWSKRPTRPKFTSHYKVKA